MILFKLVNTKLIEKNIKFFIIIIKSFKKNL